MTADLLFVAYSAVLTWVMVMTASFLRSRMWTLHGLTFAFGNRQGPWEAAPLGGRAHRAARNMMENFVLFAALVLVAHAGGVPGAQVQVGAAIFFWARVIYFAVYLAGIAYLRTAIWVASIVGLAMIFGAIVAG